MDLRRGERKKGFGPFSGTKFQIWSCIHRKPINRHVKNRRLNARRRKPFSSVLKTRSLDAVQLQQQRNNAATVHATTCILLYYWFTFKKASTHTCTCTHTSYIFVRIHTRPVTFSCMCFFLSNRSAPAAPTTLAVINGSVMSCVGT